MQFNINSLAQLNTPEFIEQVKAKIDGKTKPLGALGQLEDLAFQIALIQQQQDIEQPLDVTSAAVFVFAGDHGIAAQGISIAPSEVTQQMVANFLNGGAAINCFCAANQVQLHVVDTGVLTPLQHPKKSAYLQNGSYIESRIAAGTNDFSQTSAMTIEHAQACINQGAELIKAYFNQYSVIGFGEMGIGNTSSASALTSLLTSQAAELTVGHGTGISDEQYRLKLKLIKQSIERVHKAYQHKQPNPIECLAEVGGFEIGQIAGAMLACAQASKIVVVDGFISSAAALLACRINPNCRDYMVFAHKSEEYGHKLLLAELSAKPLLDINMRLGEGTGAALSVPLIRSAAQFYNCMASFADAEVTKVV
ncbi:nicotinate-nucleotide--dimethylbenzimidazole phosphoribosyltransferase [Catenovulum agarivorans DS-2]|uniref:Nicotinate-nucleotide--dimethylbenzimidazole phosphoribosyltransferase n=1 Tax=Catenovulum agarivorans DS-2 TaxID=1328313 RepID=W7QU21_9ALTE|nr:nicotinate-nucleotide--dimethylbenzimidazole phosphoribosyltransferase [Catenovulum agarivorans]EWH11338.1 nicotinate-nucleotide--dimethylbenzimidazole phosphoribosyltransferase [Catenovulum agarivorans DS-2]